MPKWLKAMSHSLGLEERGINHLGGLELLSPHTWVHLGGPYYWALQLLCPAGLNLFVPTTTTIKL